MSILELLYLGPMLCCTNQEESYTRREMKPFRDIECTRCKGLTVLGVFKYVSLISDVIFFFSCKLCLHFVLDIFINRGSSPYLIILKTCLSLYGNFYNLAEGVLSHHRCAVTGISTRHNAVHVSFFYAVEFFPLSGDVMLSLSPS